MQRRNLGKAMRYLVAVCTLVSAFTMFACGDDNTGEVKNVNSTVPASNSTIASVQGRAISIPSGQVFGGNIGNGPVTLTFTLVPNTFTLVNSAGVTTTGSVAYNPSGTCNFAGSGGGFVSVATCNLVVNASNVTVGHGQVSGTVTLVLSSTIGGVLVTVNSTPLTATVFIDSHDELFVVNPVTGVSVDMGVKP